MALTQRSLLLSRLRMTPSPAPGFHPYRVLRVAAAAAALSLALPTAPARADSPAFAPTVPLEAPAPSPAPEGMVWIPGGEFSMGSEIPDEGVCTLATREAVNDAQPVHRVRVDGFWMDATVVTNHQFAQFVAATGYKTVAEIAPSPEQFPGVPAENLVAGSTVFTPT